MKRWGVVCILLLLTVVQVDARTYSGETTIWKDTVWSGEILVDGIVTVAPGVTLELEPGTTVRFTRFDSNNDRIGEHELFIQGRFVARGTADQPVVFTSAQAEPQPGDWGAINMMASMSENLLEHCRVEYAYRGFHAHFGRARLRHSEFRSNTRGAQFQESDVRIEDCRFRNNLNGIQFRDSQVAISDTLVEGSHWGMRCVNSDVSVTDSTISGNALNGINFKESRVTVERVAIRNNRRGLYLQRSSGTVRQAQLADNYEHGLFAEESKVAVTSTDISRNGRAGIRVLDATLALHDSRIVGNALYAVVNDGAQDLTLTGNWWGSADRVLLGEMIRDADDRSGVGRLAIVDPLAADPGPRFGN